MTIRGHFDGKHIILDEPMPPGVPANTPVSITLENGTGQKGSPSSGLADDLRAIRIDGSDLPPDFAAQHEHYVRGC